MTLHGIRVGCKLVSHNSWPSAPISTSIIGLKELPLNDESPLPHVHIMFAHCYKAQGGWIPTLTRWDTPTSMLYDLEFLQDRSGRRVAAFGYHAGFAGAAVGTLALATQLEKEDARLGELVPYPNEDALIADVKVKLEAVKAKLGRNPRALVIGALGRCGRGAVEFLIKAGFERYVEIHPFFEICHSSGSAVLTFLALDSDDVVKWDMAETAKGGPFDEILDGLSLLHSFSPRVMKYKLKYSSISRYFCQLHLPQHQNPLFRFSRKYRSSWLFAKLESRC